MDRGAFSFALAGVAAGERAIQDAAQAAVEGAVPLRLNGWKVALVRTLVARALQALVGDAASTTSVRPWRDLTRTSSPSSIGRC